VNRHVIEARFVEGSNKGGDGCNDVENLVVLDRVEFPDAILPVGEETTIDEHLQVL
jgi:hypothetical protein